MKLHINYYSLCLFQGFASVQYLNMETASNICIYDTSVNNKFETILFPIQYGRHTLLCLLLRQTSLIPAMADTSSA